MLYHFGSSSYDLGRDFLLLLYFTICQQDYLGSEIKFAVLLLRCLKALQFNTHETSGWDTDRKKDNSIGLGGALYPTLALFNHSCNPAIVRYAFQQQHFQIFLYTK